MAELVLDVLAAYAGVGALFALAFVARGAARIEPSARGGTLGFRLAIVPGAIVLWPYLAVRWLRAPAGAGAATRARAEETRS